MRLENVSIRNFRLLRRVSIDLAQDKTTTIFVGPNNSGKTSVMEALQLFIGFANETPKISFHDLSQLRHRDLRRIEVLLAAEGDPEKRTAILKRFAPRMRLDLTFAYDEDQADLVAATQLLMDLTPGTSKVRMRIDYTLENAKNLLDEFEARPRKDLSLCEYLKDTFRDHFKRIFFKVSLDGKEVEKLDDGGLLKSLLRIDIVPAQRHVDDDEGIRSAKLSKLLHDHYQRFYQLDDAAGYQAIEDALTQSADDLTDKYGKAFGRLTTRLQSFGYPPGQKAPDLRVRAELSAETIYRDNARIYYASEHAGKGGVMEEFELPEKYNGLGYKNLIYIVLQFESFRAAIEATQGDKPRVHIIGIEEPEAHLHPQMQTVFISEISKALETDGGTTAQVLMSTHSSHMIAHSEFEPVRYFRRVGRQVIMQDLSKLPLPENDPDLLGFLRRYIRLTHCDLFFADKAIFIEGQVERLLLPMMIEEQAKVAGCETLSSQYISISEVGGAYAHKFKPIIEFLGIPSLIITDLDSVDDNNEKCPVAEGKGTSNVCLRSWIPAKANIDELMACNDAEKTQGCIRIAYQVSQNGQCGRSFEEAFIYANVPWLTANHAKLSTTKAAIKKAVDAGIVAEAWTLSAKLAKVDFALDLINSPGWVIPLYIQQGLKWLAEHPAR
ncbi:AAA family ATPase [Hyphococcus luteus]|uniref:ATP-dependent endonuclease n=1 Tax=Hyphococcus luteus TaxID=2058213 RepID=A0A2S7K4X7_9PROT|nr:ATP-dependent endonuclease [Marinicaulis flavus]PQA87564.1 ATP-dependent endonuclease [Marinicaulis flavus]